MPRFSPPGNVPDLTRDADLQAWSDLVNGVLQGEIDSLTAQIGAENVQLVNPLTTAILNAQPRQVPWFTFPQDVWDHMPRAAARTRSDDPANRRPSFQGQNEYSEWYTHRDSAGNVTAVDVTTELPEYWTFLSTHLTRAEFVAIYRQYVSGAIVEADLFPGGGPYDPLNPYNTTRGTMHMINNINTLGAAVPLVADATVWRFSGTDPIDVQDCSFFPSHHADPTIIAHFNRMAREGRLITLRDPVGVYILDIDTMGWQTPDGSDPRRLVSLNRGTPAVRARVSVRRGCRLLSRKRPRFKLSDVTICGEPIRSGSQIAERVTVGVIAMVGAEDAVTATRGTTCGMPVFFALSPGDGDAIAEAAPARPQYGRTEP